MKAIFLSFLLLSALTAFAEEYTPNATIVDMNNISESVDTYYMDGKPIALAVFLLNDETEVACQTNVYRFKDKIIYGETLYYKSTVLRKHDYYISTVHWFETETVDRLMIRCINKLPLKTSIEDFNRHLKGLLLLN